jgi:hypothetical protein
MVAKVGYVTCNSIVIAICTYSFVAHYNIYGISRVMCRMLTVVRNHRHPQDFFTGVRNPKYYLQTFFEPF